MATSAAHHGNGEREEKGEGGHVKAKFVTEARRRGRPPRFPVTKCRKEAAAPFVHRAENVMPNSTRQSCNVYAVYVDRINH